MNIINIGDSFDNLFLQIERLNVNLSDVLNRIQNVESDVSNNSSMTSLLEEQIITLNSSYTELSTLVKNLELDIDTIKDYENKVMIKLKSFGDKLQEILRLRTDD
jgi:predicted  nucleic acid-binding Zn-ribbon protein